MSALQQELQEVEEKWAAKLEDAVDGIGVLKTRLEERDIFFFFFISVLAYGLYHGETHAAIGAPL